MTIFETPELQRDIRGHEFYGPELREIPPLYATEEVPKDEKVVFARFFLSTSEWFICELDPETGIAFGFACLGGDTLNAEMGYVSLFELEGLVLGLEDVGPQHQSVSWVVQRDLSWTPKPLGEAIRHLSI